MSSGGSLGDLSVWSFFLIIAVLLFVMLLANFLKRSVKFLKKSLIPSSVLGGIILLIISTAYFFISGGTNGGKYVFDTEFFGGNGLSILEILTYHGLGIGFVAITMRSNTKKFDKKRTGEIFDTGVITVSTYLIQGILGLIITIVFAFAVTSLLPASGILLPFGFGQGTGQAFNYGNLFETDYDFVGGRSFGLTIAALGFLSASIGGVIYLNYLRRKGKISDVSLTNEELNLEQIQGKDEIPMNGSIDKLTVQVGIVFGVYAIAFLIMYGVSQLLPGQTALIFGFNFLFGVLIATLLKFILHKLKSKGIMKKEYVNSFLMDRISGFAFDMMIVAGIAAIQIHLIVEYWYILLILGVLGAFITFFYVKFVSFKFFKDYKYEQFFVMYGMLTGTASTGMILLREIDPNFKTPAADNLVYQNFPAIVFGFPMMFIAAYAPTSSISAYVTLGVVIGFFILMNVILFRRQIFKKKVKTAKQ